VSVARTLPSLVARSASLADPAEQRRLLRHLPLARGFATPLRATGIDVLQINVGKLCNQTCRHCHVDAGPDRREVMTRETMELCLDALRASAIPTVDITGGAPELNPHFRWLVEQVRTLGRHVMDRCNLTVLETGPHRDLPAFWDGTLHDCDFNQMLAMPVAAGRRSRRATSRPICTASAAPPAPARAAAARPRRSRGYQANGCATGGSACTSPTRGIHVSVTALVPSMPALSPMIQTSSGGIATPRYA
jgi:hypothetical protein